MANNIPTAEVILKYLIPNAKDLMTARQYENAINAIRAHGIYYVTAALKAASEQADLIETDGDIDPSTILNAYPLDLIK